MSVNGLGTPLTALKANQFRQDVTANNIANVNTQGFKASTVTTADRAYINGIGTGTQVTGTYAPPRSAPQTAASPARQPLENSTTDMIREMTNMRSAQNAYSSNAVMTSTQDNMTQTVLDIKR